MSEYKLTPLASGFKREGPLVLLVLDGYGLGKDDPTVNPIIASNPKYFNGIIEEAKKLNLYKKIRAHGPAVGLPSEDDMGNSEVGHNAMGAGQIYKQGTMLVDSAFESGSMFTSDGWKQTVTDVAANGGTLHLFGLLSDGNIHSHIRQVDLLIDGAIKSGIKKLRVHPLLDGRDVDPLSGLAYIEKLETKLAEVSAGGIDAKIGSGGGRMYCIMDRYNSDWGIVRRGWNAMVRGVIEPEDISENYKGYYTTAKEAIEACRAAFPDRKDQFNLPFVIVDDKGVPIGTVKDGDAVVNYNFRGDRAIQISRAFDDDDFTGFVRENRPKNIHYAGLLEYDSDWHIPRHYLVPPPTIQNTLSHFLLAQDITSYAIAETHKYGHVTYFWNGNKTGYVDKTKELYEQITSLPNAETESHPQMKAKEVTDNLIVAIESGKFKFLRSNIANGDMVGHTGNFESCVTSVTVIDQCIERIDKVVAKLKGVLIITADHGNVEDKRADKSKTSHTCLPVLFMIRDYQYKGEYTLIPDNVKPDVKPGDDAAKVEGSGLSNVAATLINLMGYEPPAFYRKSMIVFK